MTTKIPGILTKITPTQFTFTPDSELSEGDYRFVISSSFKSTELVPIGSRKTITFNSSILEISPWILTNYNYGGTIPYTDKAWILTNYKYETNTFDSLNDGWVLALEYYDTDFEGLADGDNIGIFTDGSS